MDLPLSGIELQKRRALRRGAEADEAQAIACRRAIAGEVADRVAVGLAGSEHERVVAAAPGERVGTAETVEHVREAIAGYGIDMARAVGVLEVEQRVGDAA